MESQLQSPSPLPSWSNIVKQAPMESPIEPQSSTKLFKTTNNTSSSTKPIAIAIVDANAIIQGGEILSNFADKFVSIPQVLSEIRDPTSRHRLSFLPFAVDTMDPSPEALKKVISFARATGDLQTLSDVDLKLIALTYTLEAQIHGTTHLRDTPPPIHVMNVRRLPEKDLPGWGSNVPNLEEWEALEGANDGSSDPTSRILPLKDLTLNIPAEDRASSLDGSIGNDCEDRDGFEVGSRRSKRYPPKKREVKIDGKKMVAAGIDASQGKCDDHDHDNGGDWRPAVSRSTHRRFLRRQARREMYEASLKDEEQQDIDKNNNGESQIEVEHSNVDKDVFEENKGIKEKHGVENVSSILEQMRLEEDSEQNNSVLEVPLINAKLENGVDHDHDDNDDILDKLENESVDISLIEDDGSERSWMLRSLSESSVACITADFAMQNVILQMGLRLIAPGGMQIRELNRWVLKCHACQNVTVEVGRVFCPKCGNGGTLRKVAVTVGENGVVLQARRHRISLRGTKFSLPLPQGGRDAITKNPVLREDQLPHKFLYPKTKKKSNKEDDFFGVDNIFSHHTDKKAPLRPPVRQALAVFSGKRNPNDNHYSRSKH